MIKRSLLPLLAIAGSLAACTGDTNNSTQAQIDSAANARTAAMEAQMKVKNDSIINQMAQIKADSSLFADSIAASAHVSSNLPVTASNKPVTHPNAHGTKTPDAATPVDPKRK